MQIFALFMFLGMLTSLLVPESKGMRLEELAGEKEDVYELQFRSGFFTRKERGSGSSKGTARKDRVGGRGPTGGVGADVEKGRWWKL